MKRIESDIQARVDAFVDELTEMIRTAAMDSIREALLGEAAPAPRRKPGRPRKAKAAKATKVVRKAKAAKRGKRVRRSSALVSKIGDKVLAHVTAHPGLRLGEIAKAIGVATKDARRPAFLLLEAKKLKTTGQRGGTRYFPAGAKTSGGGAKATKTKKAKKRRTAKRKTSKK